MNFSLSVVTAPAVEPVDLAWAKRHCRVEHSRLDGSMFPAWIQAARETVEKETNRSLIKTRWAQRHDCWPGCNYIELRRSPLIAVISVKWKDSTGAETTLAAGADYIVDTATTPGRIVLPYGGSWPSGTLYPASPITITYDAGYGEAATDVPMRLKQAMLLLIGHYFLHPSEVVLGGQQGAAITLPRGVASLLKDEKVHYFGG